jgi:Nucleotide-diphospho-sugar transferase
MSGDRGVLYVATGTAHVAAARASAASVRRTNPGLATAIFCDVPEPGPEFDRAEAVVDPHRRSKVDYLPRTPFRKTLYLDTDTRVLGPLDDLFRLLERFDLALAHVAAPHTRSALKRWRQDVPPSFPQHNGGVMLYRATPASLAFLEAWRSAYHASGHKVDQVTLRELLWSSDIRFTVLLPRYNTRRYTWLDRWFSRQAAPVILHINRFHPTKHSGFRRWISRLGGPNG